MVSSTHKGDEKNKSVEGNTQARNMCTTSVPPATPKRTKSTSNNMSTPRMTRSATSAKSSDKSDSGERGIFSGGSRAKRLRSCGMIEDTDTGSTESGKKRRRRSSTTLLQALHDSSVSNGTSPIVNRAGVLFCSRYMSCNYAFICIELKNGSDISVEKAAVEDEVPIPVVNERQNALNKNLIGFANRLIESAK